MAKKPKKKKRDKLSLYSELNCILHRRYLSKESEDRIVNEYKFASSKLANKLSYDMQGSAVTLDELSQLFKSSASLLTSGLPKHKAVFDISSSYIDTLIEHSWNLHGLESYYNTLRCAMSEPILRFSDAHSGLSLSKIVCLFVKGVYDSSDELVPNSSRNIEYGYENKDSLYGDKMVLAFTYTLVDGSFGDYYFPIYSVRDLERFIETVPDKSDINKYYAWLSLIVFDAIMSASRMKFSEGVDNVISMKKERDTFVITLPDEFPVDEMPFYSNKLSCFYQGMPSLFGCATKAVYTDIALDVLNQMKNLEQLTDTNVRNTFSVAQDYLLSQQRVVFVYNNHISKKLRKRYQGDEIITQEMLKHLPYKSFSIYNQDTGFIYNVSPMQDMMSVDASFYGITIITSPLVYFSFCLQIDTSFDDYASAVSSASLQFYKKEQIYESPYYGNKSRQVRDALKDIYFIVYHVIQSTLARRDKKVSTSNSLTTSKSDNRQRLNHSDIEPRFSAPITLFELTPKTYKTYKVSSEHAKGWRQPKHVRRAHLHRYWVGKGDDRRLVARWVDSTIVNEDLDDSQVITVRRLELGG